MTGSFEYNKEAVLHATRVCETKPCAPCPVSSHGTTGRGGQSRAVDVDEYEAPLVFLYLWPDKLVAFALSSIYTRRLEWCGIQVLRPLSEVEENIFYDWQRETTSLLLSFRPRICWIWWRNSSRTPNEKENRIGSKSHRNQKHSHATRRFPELVAPYIRYGKHIFKAVVKLLQRFKPWGTVLPNRISVLLCRFSLETSGTVVKLSYF